MFEAVSEKAITLLNFLRVLFPPELIAATLAVSLVGIFILYKKSRKR